MREHQFASRSCKRAAGTLALMLCASAGLVAAASGYQLVERWGSLPPGQEWGEVTGVVVDARNTIVAVRRSEPPIVELNPAGKVLKTWGENLFVWPHGVRVDQNGFFWVTDGRAKDGRGEQVMKIAPDGRVVLALGTKGVAGETPETFSGPADVAFGANGDIFVADGHVNNRIVKFTKDGRFIKAWGPRARGGRIQRAPCHRD
jgi:hypothetical protein